MFNLVWRHDVFIDFAARITSLFSKWRHKFVLLIVLEIIKLSPSNLSSLPARLFNEGKKVLPAVPFSSK